ncbi:MAG: hypothetical protein QOH68_766 [Nocardioidaceae bacterium]|nr:hypothetical protein [Nocardioidaceae bacterium]
MAIALDSSGTRPVLTQPARTTLLSAAALFSLGAGAIHAAAIGVHAEHRQAALAFTFVATAQLCWGCLAHVRSGRVVAMLGVLLGAGAVAGWAVAKSSGLGFIDGLEISEPIQTADALAAGLALVGTLVAALSLRGGRNPHRAVSRLPIGLASVGVTALTVFGMVAAGTHVHSHGAAGHTHLTATGESASGADHAPAVVPPVPYDPTKPIDLGGVPGVTLEEQAAAENEVAITVLRLPQWSDPAVAEAAGFRSIGDGFTGVEHFVNAAFMDDDSILDPDRPESLVYSTEGGGRRLVAAMYMLKRGTPLSDVPNIGGKLMQWHTHENLCYNAEGKVRGITDADGNCPTGLVKPVPTPMIHVWIEPHKCGPFAALEGIGGGTIAQGEEVLCDHVHGSS